jgi:hypothetical protein
MAQTPSRLATHRHFGAERKGAAPSLVPETPAPASGNRIRKLATLSPGDAFGFRRVNRAPNATILDGEAWTRRYIRYLEFMPVKTALSDKSAWFSRADEPSSPDLEGTKARRHVTAAIFVWPWTFACDRLRKTGDERLKAKCLCRIHLMRI